MYTMSVNEAKVVFLGRAAVGKTSIIEHYCRKTFSEFQEPTIGAAFNTVTIPTTPESTRIGIWVLLDKKIRFSLSHEMPHALLFMM